MAAERKVTHGVGSARAPWQPGHRMRYYYGRCECGYRGPNRTSPGRAREDALKHARKAVQQA